MEPESHRDRRKLSALTKLDLYRIALRTPFCRVTFAMRKTEMVDAICAGRASARKAKVR